MSGAACARDQPERVRNENRARGACAARVVAAWLRASMQRTTTGGHGRHVYCLAARRRGGLIVKLSDTRRPRARQFDYRVLNRRRHRHHLCHHTLVATTESSLLQHRHATTVSPPPSPTPPPGRGFLERLHPFSLFTR